MSANLHFVDGTMVPILAAIDAGPFGYKDGGKVDNSIIEFRNSSQRVALVMASKVLYIEILL